MVGALFVQAALRPALADNPMGYRILTAADASKLPHNHGLLGIDVERAGDLSDDGLSFELMRVKTVRPSSPGQAAGLKVGDEIIAVDGRVFPDIATFAAYIGSLSPGTAATFDSIPAGGGPAQAQRLTVRIGPNSTHMSTDTKLAIGAGAVALLGCYELGCFSHPKPANNSGVQPNLPSQRSAVSGRAPVTPANETASATCRDGTSWTGARREQACSNHGGVRALDVPSSGNQVWVNTRSKVYHCAGDPNFGKTKRGAYMTEAAAKADGDRPSGGKVCF